jgi:hypothetical protein
MRWRAVRAKPRSIVGVIACWVELCGRADERLGIRPCLVAGRFQPTYAIFQCRVIKSGDSALDGVVEPLQAQLGLGGALVQLGDMLAAPIGTILPPVEDGGQNLLKPVRIKQAFFQMTGDEIVQLLHWHGHAVTSGCSLSRLGRAGIIAIAPGLACANGHRPAALAAMDEASEQRGAADTCGCATFGLRAFKCAYTASNVAWSMIGGTATAITSPTGFSSLVLPRLLNSWRPA